jgi:hypothetical protein
MDSSDITGNIRSNKNSSNFVKKRNGESNNFVEVNLNNNIESLNNSSEDALHIYDLLFTDPLTTFPLYQNSDPEGSSSDKRKFDAEEWSTRYSLSSADLENIKDIGLSKNKLAKRGAPKKTRIENTTSKVYLKHVPNIKEIIYNKETLFAPPILSQSNTSFCDMSKLTGSNNSAPRQILPSNTALITNNRKIEAKNFASHSLKSFGLENKSNYQAILEGKGSVLGLPNELVKSIEKRRIVHRFSEKKRRQELMTLLGELKELIPSLAHSNNRLKKREMQHPTKCCIVKKAIEYIKELKNELELLKPQSERIG